MILTLKHKHFFFFLEIRCSGISVCEDVASQQGKMLLMQDVLGTTISIMICI